MQDGRESAHRARTEPVVQVTAHRVRTEREGEVGFIVPPRAEFGDEVEPGLVVCELPFVDDEPRVYAFGIDRWDDLVERHGDDPWGAGHEQLKRQVGAGAHAGDRDERVVGRKPFGGVRFAGDDFGPIRRAHRGAERGEDVLLADVRVGVHGDRGDVQVRPVDGAVVERLDVFGDGHELERPGVDRCGRARGAEGPPHEGVVRVGGVGDGKAYGFGHRGMIARVSGAGLCHCPVMGLRSSARHGETEKENHRRTDDREPESPVHIRDRRDDGSRAQTRGHRGEIRARREGLARRGVCPRRGLPAQAHAPLGAHRRVPARGVQGNAAQPDASACAARPQERDRAARAGERIKGHDDHPAQAVLQAG